MKKNNIASHNPFSLIADFEGDIDALFNQCKDETLPILPVRNMVLFPGVVAPVSVGRRSTHKLARSAAEKDCFIGVVCQRDAEKDAPRREDLYDTGVVAKVVRIMEMPDGNLSVILQAFSRFTLLETTREKPYMRARVVHLEEQTADAVGNKEFEALSEACRDNVMKLIKANDDIRNEAAFALKNIHNPYYLVSFIGTNLPFAAEEKIALLEENNPLIRASQLLKIIARDLQFALLKQEIEQRTRQELDQQQKEYYLGQLIKNLQTELGQEPADDVTALREKALELDMPEGVKAVFEREVQKLSRINMQSPDYNVQLNFLQTLTSLPWGKTTEDRLDIKAARRTLERDHYGMDEVKMRILEHLAVMKLQNKTKSTILCLYGPPGVGKTSLGRSIADALGRRYVRMSLGGVHDEAEIRGHRRTYVGAMPGRIIKGILKAGVNNPVFILDEIDKVGGANFNGDPQSALLEVLDPEQNATFHDNFLDIDYDLSQVMFIATANTLSTIPSPLLDRMEIIEVEGYLAEEKREIARRHLIPKLERQTQLGEKLKFAPRAIDTIIEKYTRESGVRSLEKQLEKVFRKVAYRTALDGSMPFSGHSLTPADVAGLLGKPLYNRDKYQGNEQAGVVTGLAWTAAGGEILFIETSLSRSKAPKLTLTGNLGDVMKESAALALEYVKAHADTLGIDYAIFENWSIHIHVPEGATPKDGPSAGITIATSIVSALTSRKVKARTAMTGEITLRGKVLPVGGIKEKILAAKRAGITDIIMSQDNKRDIDEINAQYVDGLTFHFVECVEDVLKIALPGELVDRPQDFTIHDAQPAATAAQSADRP